MGKNNGNSWFNAVKKAFRSPSNDDEKKSSKRREANDPELEDEQKKRGKKRWIFRRHLSLETTIHAKCANSSAVRICSGEENLVRKQPKIETEQRRAFAVAMATTAAAEAAVASAQAAVEIIRFTKPPLLIKKDKAALLIQKYFRGYLARRALMALRGVVKLQAVIRGHNVRKRAKMTLKCIESLVRVQSIVCDQRRRLSCEAASFGSIFSHHKNSSRVSSSLDVNPSELEEIRNLIQKAKECSLKQGKTLAHALSEQIWGKEDDEFSEKSVYSSSIRKDRNLCNPIKNVEVDDASFSLYNHHKPNLESMLMATPFHGKHLTLPLQSPKTPSYSKTRSIPCSPCFQHEGRKSESAETPTWRRRMSMTENSCPLPRPNYMAATASAMARVRPNSTPRLRRTSPTREAMGSARKRLSFPVVHDGHDFGDKSNFQRCDEPYYYGTD